MQAKPFLLQKLTLHKRVGHDSEVSNSVNGSERMDTVVLLRFLEPINMIVWIHIQRQIGSGSLGSGSR